MEEFDENGWAHIHHAAFNGYHKSVSRFVKSKDDQLELETQDGQQSTPFLLSCTSGVLDTVQLLVELGANLKATNRHSQGAVLLAALHGHIHILEYFLELNHESSSVWEELIKGLALQDMESASAKVLVELTLDEKEKNYESFVSIDGVKAVVQLLKKSFPNEEPKTFGLSILLNIVKYPPAKQQLGEIGIPAIISQLKENQRPLYMRASKILGELAFNEKNKATIASNNGVDALVNLLQNNDDEEVVDCVLRTIKNLADSNSEIQTLIGNNKTTMKSFVNLLTEVKNKHVLATVARTISMIVKTHSANQDGFINEGGIPPLMELMKIKSRECQFAVVEAIQALCEKNENNQTIVTDLGCVMMLMRLLKRSRQADLRKLTASALWAIAGNKNTQRRSIANEIGVNMLIEFLSENLSQSLHFIGSEALGVLADGVHKKRDEIAEANGVMPLVRLLTKASTPGFIVLSVLRTLRSLCLCVGFRPHLKNQKAVSNEGGIKFLIRFMVHARQEIIKVEAAYTLGSVSLGNSDNMKEVLEHREFSFLHILRLLYDEDEEVALLSGAALALFAYNNVANQKAIAVSGGVRYHSFLPFLESKDLRQVAHAAFQIIILSRIIPDEDQSLTCATGVKLLVSLLECQSEDIQTLAANFLGGLSHTRAGVPAAIISIGTIDLLAKLLMSPFETVQASAAVTLGFLSYDKVGERQLLNTCRHDPFLYKVLQFHAGKVKLSPDFVERWKHYKKIGLPPIISKPSHLNMGDKKLVTTQFALDADQTFTVVSTNTTSPGIMGSDDQERKVSASTRTGTIMKLPIA
ncbi:ankyrin and armadillo repeat-containing protein-like [Actinia tenebrosa]|uniref:Ankyrin and armadillo repeat-containing protein-like n=1 Tax=Actinia tenebrosa TaxID=6105 RepID=A0A6P8I6R7_ACTTE|nr:ankyrin and armadillo repeat-containing protein-like [Actinia tenebrosa]